MTMLKYLIKILIGKEIIISPQIKIDSKWYGTKHAGFFVYTKFLNSDSVLYSFGVGEDISFDEELISEFNCIIYAFDPTPKKS